MGGSGYLCCTISILVISVTNISVDVCILTKIVFLFLF